MGLTCFAKPEDLLGMHLIRRLFIEATRTCYSVIVLEVKTPVTVLVSARNGMKIWTLCQYQKTLLVSTVDLLGRPPLIGDVVVVLTTWVLLTLLGNIDRRAFWP
jgi:hypothetical protein